MAAEESQANWVCYIVEVGDGCGDGYEGGLSVTFICNTKRLVVDIPPSSPADETPIGQWIERYNTVFLDEDDDEAEAVQKEIQDALNDIARPLFARLAPPLINGSEHTDLHSLLYPETFYFRLAAVNGKLDITQQDAPSEWDDPPFPLRLNDDLGLPTYLSKEIQVLTKLLGEGSITQVLVDGQERCCKSGNPCDGRALEREFNCLRKIAQSPYATSIRVPRLVGLVASSDNGRVIGFLEEYIPTDWPGVSMLRDVDTSTVTKSRRKKWSSQIRETVDLLHEIGVIWGDGKPHNILIHRDTDDAWLIDFGGSWTDGWVDEDLVETQEGDEQAVGKILEFLKI